MNTPMLSMRAPMAAPTTIAIPAAASARQLRKGPRRTLRRAARGSAYLVVLLALVVLTLLALAVSQIAQTEMAIGANEMTIQRVLYAADAGVAASAARALAAADYDPLTMTVPEQDRAIAFQSLVDVSPFLPIQVGYCQLCDISQGSEYRQIVYGVTSTAVRQGLGADIVEQGRKTVSVMIEVQPWLELVLDLTDEEKAKIKF